MKYQRFFKTRILVHLLVYTQNYHLNIKSKICALCAAAIMLLVVSTCLLLVAQLATPSGEPLLRLPLQATPSGELLRSARSAASELASSSSEAASDWSHCPSACKCKWASGKRTADCESGGLESLPLFPRYVKRNILKAFKTYFLGRL